MPRKSIEVTLKEFCQKVEIGDEVKMPYQRGLQTYSRVREIEGPKVKDLEAIKAAVSGGYTGGICCEGWNIEWGNFERVRLENGWTMDELLENVKVKVRTSRPEKFTAKKENPTQLDTKPFEKLILPQDIKDEIIAVLKQHTHSTVIFEEWGLGEIVKYGKGMIFLFYGYPGTGKTYCANVMAEALAKKLFAVGTAELQSQEPGAFERNLRTVLKSKKDQVVLLDECDGMVQSRQGMGQIISAENNTLLQEIEKFEGVLVMTTNRIQTLDEALERRVSLIVEFPKPDKEARTKIWQSHIPSRMPLAKDVRFDKLSEEELTGGQIKNAVLNAARFCVARTGEAVAMEDFVKAIKRVKEGRKAFSQSRNSHVQNTDMGKSISTSNFGPVKERPNISF